MTERPRNYYDVAVGGRAVYVRVHGLASMNNCLCVREFIEDRLRSGHRFIIVDLKDCGGVDSTFMGVLAAAATFDRKDPPPGIAVVNASPALRKLLEGVGLAELVYIDVTPFEAPGVEFVRLDETGDEQARLACIRDAHQRLIQVDAANARVFGPFLTALEADMKARGMM